MVALEPPAGGAVSFFEWDCIESVDDLVPGRGLAFVARGRGGCRWTSDRLSFSLQIRACSGREEEVSFSFSSSEEL